MPWGHWTSLKDKANHSADVLSINIVNKAAVIDDLDLEVRASKLHELVFEISLFGRKSNYFPKFKESIII